MERHERSIAKAISWRVIATLTTMSLVYIFTGNLEITGIVGFFDVVIKLFFYYLHERAWLAVAWGRKK